MIQTVNNNLSVDRGSEPNARNGLRKSKPGAEGEVDFAASLMQLGQTLNPQQPAIVTLGQQQQPQGEMHEGEKGEAMQATQMAKSLERAGNAKMANPELQPTMLKTTASMNTAAAIAGLKPWSKDWVFEGGMDQNADLKPLFENMNPSGSPLATQDLESLRTMRGEAAQAGAAEKQQAGAVDLNAKLQETGATLEAMDLMDPSAKGPAPAKLGNGLSGAEFLSTLSAIRGTTEDKSSAQFGAGQEQGSGERKEGESRLKDLAGLKGRKSLMKEDLMATRPLDGQIVPPANMNAGAANAVTQVTGHVVQGAMSRNRLSSEALQGLSTGIRNLTPAGGGEIRMRLKPEALGEVNIRVLTQGNSVSLQIRASDDSAKKVLEESLGHLKESLAIHQLNLGTVDVGVSQAQNSAGSDFRQNSDQQQAQQNAFHGQMMEQNRGQNSWGGEGNAREQGLDAGLRNSRNLNASRASAAISSGPARAASGRLDVTA